MGCLRPSSAFSAGRFQSGPTVDDPELRLATRVDSDDFIAKGLPKALARLVEAQGAGRSPGWTGHHGRGAFSRGSGAWLDGTKHTSNLFLDELCSAFPGRYGACA
jgi:hypothetical protein